MEKTAPRKQLPAFAVLCIISLVAAVVLAATNMITRGPIARHQEEALRRALGTVLSAEAYEPLAVPEAYEVSSLYEARAGGEVIGWCVTASATGYGGRVAVTLGVDRDGLVTGCVVGDINFSETSGYGSRARDADFQDQFKGISVVEGGTFDALTGATMTSDAVRRAVDKALKCVAEVAMGQTAPVPVVSFSEK